MARLEISLDPLDSGWRVKVLNPVTYETTQHAISSLAEMPAIPERHARAVDVRDREAAE